MKRCLGALFSAAGASWLFLDRTERERFLGEVIVSCRGPKGEVAALHRATYIITVYTNMNACRVLARGRELIEG